MKQLTLAGRFLYGFGLVAVGVHQLILKNFRPEILPPFPAWAHEYAVLPVLAGVALIFCGVVISGMLPIKAISAKNVCLYLGFSFLVLVITCQLPYILVLSTDKLSRLDIWFGAAEELAYCGGAFVMAGSFPRSNYSSGEKNAFTLLLERIIPAGPVFFCILMILFGWSHFLFTAFVSTMVPKWIGMPIFWTYFVGTALIGAGIAIICRIWKRQVAFLLAVMLFLFFLFFHVPDAIAHPSEGSGNEIVRAIVALVFTGIALVISTNAKRIN
jgi:uncharacterized membrane protein YphA (DoxX/SURF4 family)